MGFEEEMKRSFIARPAFGTQMRVSIFLQLGKPRQTRLPSCKCGRAVSTKSTLSSTCNSLERVSFPTNDSDWQVHYSARQIGKKIPFRHAATDHGEAPEKTNESKPVSLRRFDAAPKPWAFGEASKRIVGCQSFISC